jgi:hypothetical protein
MKAQYKFLISIIFLMAILPMVSAYDSLGTFKQYDCVNLAQTCSNCTFVNISSVLYPDSIQALGQVAMTKLGTSYNYTMCGKANMTGDYLVNGFGDLDGKNEVFTYSFTVTPAGGLENNTTLFIIFSIISLVLLLLAFIFKNYIFAVISGFSFMSTGVYVMVFGLSNISNLYTKAIALIIIGFGAIITITSALDLMDNMGGEEFSGGTTGEEEED